MAARLRMERSDVCEKTKPVNATVAAAVDCGPLRQVRAKGVRALRALVVDDSAVMRLAMTEALSSIPGLSCVTAVDGADGIRRLGGERFDIVLTDLNMPILNGLALVSYIRRQPELQALPIVVVTTESAEEDRRRLLKAGADAYVVKPIVSATLQARVRELLRLEALDEGV
ncbi:MAG: response regulator [Myxococcales bacterium]